MTNLPNKDTSKPTTQQGVFNKFTVTRNDGDPTGKHKDCEYFVLDTKHDPFAVYALASYAVACKATHPELSDDMMKRFNIKSLVSWADRSDEWTPAITESHPVKTKAYWAYEKAINMVGNRKSKYALVDLVCWLLQRLDDKDKQIEQNV